MSPTFRRAVGVQKHLFVAECGILFVHENFNYCFRHKQRYDNNNNVVPNSTHHCICMEDITGPNCDIGNHHESTRVYVL